MTVQYILQPQEFLDKGCTRSVTREVWLLQITDNCPVQVELSWCGESVFREFVGDWLLLLNGVNVRVLEGRLSLRCLRLEMLSKLLGFIDESRNIERFDTQISHWTALSLQDVTVLQDKKRCEYWFLQQLFDPSPIFYNLLTLLRHNEGYFLVRFLLAQSTCNHTLRELGQSYGVSYSHFRRLCSHALGGAAKAELRDWRMARSLLDMVNGQDNFTQVALKHGYASSSHFSSEIKGLLGMSPRGLSNIIQLATK